MKQVIVIRNDLNMRKGKMVAQGCHACLGATTIALSRAAKDVRAWMEMGQTKICVKVQSEQALKDIYQAALAAKIPTKLVTDSGKTEFKGIPTLTACALGPAEDHLIDAITGGLTLL